MSRNASSLHLRFAHLLEGSFRSFAFHPVSAPATWRRSVFADRADAAGGNDPDLAVWLFAALFLGVIAVLSLPAARSVSAAFGWMPLWLIGMPIASLLARYLLRLPRRRTPDSSPAVRRRPGTTPAPRRRGIAAQADQRRAA